MVSYAAFYTRAGAAGAVAGLRPIYAVNESAALTALLLLYQILADQALEEGRHAAALRLYKASLASAPPPLPPPPTSSSSSSSCRENDVGGGVPHLNPQEGERKEHPCLVVKDTGEDGGDGGGDGGGGGGQEALGSETSKSTVEAAAAHEAAAATEAATTTTAATATTAAAAAAEEDVAAAVRGDALHGVGVALLAAGKFRAACRAWKR